ncbi:unnamed protein product [Onchocerca ochengi]|uniref:Uncharacterized protein n=2 Tax=Onchocerca TaxID=6281 RepID=A0A2K6VWZ6_ONCVO|nr:unnamed protein product [Onchocerca ochengi]
MRKLPLKTSLTSAKEAAAEKDVHIPESVITEEIFVPIGKSSRDPLPPKGVMTANKNKIKTQIETGITHRRTPPTIQFTEERHRSRTISIFNEQKSEE